MPRPRRAVLCGALSALLLIASAPSGADALLDAARRHLAAKDARSAFALLAPHEAQRAGEPEYDYLLGVAALDAGDAQRAVFALERVLAMEPRNLQARAEIGRAFFVLGERQGATRELAAVRAEREVPPEVAANIDRFLSALAPVRTRLTGYAEGTWGFDTNANSATAQNQIGIPALGGAIGTLVPGAVRRRDSYLAEGLGLAINHSLTDSVSLVGGVSQAARFNRHVDTFDTSVIEGNAGLRVTADDHAFTVAGQSQYFRLDNARFRDSNGGVAQWQWNVDARTQISAFGQLARLVYPSQTIRDADRVVGGAAIARGFDVRLAPVGFVSGYFGHEEARDAGFDYLGFRLAGVRAGGQARLAARLSAFANVAFERRSHLATDPFFLVTRLDHQIDYRAGVSWTFAAGWSLSPQIAHTDNRSNIELNRYSRTVTSITVRREF